MTSPYRPDVRSLKWSPAEKAAARKAFDLALRRELEAVVAETKVKAARIQEPSDLWELERYLTGCRKQIDAQYDFRYSVLPFVFGKLLREGRLSEEELRGLAADKIEFIRSYSGL